MPSSRVLVLVSTYFSLKALFLTNLNLLNVKPPTFICLINVTMGALICHKYEQHTLARSHVNIVLLALNILFDSLKTFPLQNLMWLLTARNMDSSLGICFQTNADIYHLQSIENGHAWTNWFPRIQIHRRQKKNLREEKNKAFSMHSLLCVFSPLLKTTCLNNPL